MDFNALISDFARGQRIAASVSDIDRVIGLKGCGPALTATLCRSVVSRFGSYADKPLRREVNAGGIGR